MEDFDWKSEITSWISNKRYAKHYDEDLIEFFRNAFDYNLRPDKALFGTNESSISVLAGNIYFAALTEKGTIWLLLDTSFDLGATFNFSITKSTKQFTEPLFWLETADFASLASINNNKDIWQSYKRASEKIFKNKSITAHRAHTAYGKLPLNQFWTPSNGVENSITIKDLEITLDKQIQSLKTLPTDERLQHTRTYSIKPEKVIVTQYAFKRNPLVVLEVLERANGVCEKCKKLAPFVRDNDGTPYLEVHHIIPLANNGDDTTENAIALCANCHRHAHYGKSSY
jgi:5-methylcytosine-specific restriction endonuclease McrA